jgi:hypothetical protein
MEERELQRIRRRWDEYSIANRSAYKAFMFEAHNDMGRLLEEIDRLKKLSGRDDVRTVLVSIPETLSKEGR